MMVQNPSGSVPSRVAKRISRAMGRGHRRRRTPARGRYDQWGVTTIAGVDPVDCGRNGTARARFPASAQQKAARSPSSRGAAAPAASPLSQDCRVVQSVSEEAERKPPRAARLARRALPVAGREERRQHQDVTEEDERGEDPVLHGSVTGRRKTRPLAHESRGFAARGFGGECLPGAGVKLTASLTS